MKLNFEKVNELMITKYKAKIISKQQFKDSLYGMNRNDLSDDIFELSEGLIKTENCVFYLINDVDVLHKNCSCVNPDMFPSGKVMPTPLSMFYPYILFVAEKSLDGNYIISYAKWGTFADNIFSNLQSLQNNKQ